MKIIGSVLIILSSVVISHRYEREKRQSIDTLKEIRDFIHYIRTQIEYFSLPLCEIYARYNKKSKPILCVIEKTQIIGIPSSVQDEITRCFNSLGNGYAKEQMNSLEYLSVKISETITREEKENEKKIKIFRAISVFIGCSVVILLV